MNTDILDTAKDILAGSRMESYGAPQESFKNIARVNSILLRKYIMQDLDEHAVALFMMGLKLVRHSNRYSDDNLIDLAGYAQLDALCSK